MNTKGKWTPGPWKLDDNLTECESPSVIADMEDGWGICTVDGMPNAKREQAGNALLISKAPELVERLEAFQEWYAHHFEDFDAETNAQLLCLSNDNESLLKELGAI